MKHDETHYDFIKHSIGWGPMNVVRGSDYEQCLKPEN